MDQDLHREKPSLMIFQFLPAIYSYAKGNLTHLSWIAIGRAQFRQMPDSTGSLFGFFFLYWAVGVLSHLFTGSPMIHTVIGMAIYLLLITVSFARPGRSTVMIGVAMGCSVIADCLRILLGIAETPTFLAELLISLVEVVLLLANYRHFRSMPEDVQRRGYKRR